MVEVSQARMDALLASAKEVLERAWSPYSGLRVGAAILCADGSVATGCNVENASYGLTLCAERAAVARAVATGQRALRALALVCDGPRPVLPCGACRQVLAEFVDDLPIVAAAHGQAGGGSLETRLSVLLPAPFGPGDLGDPRDPRYPRDRRDRGDRGDRGDPGPAKAREEG